LKKATAVAETSLRKANILVVLALIVIAFNFDVCEDSDDFLKTKCIKGELNLDKKWQSDDLFYIIMNEIHPRFNKF